MTNSIGEIRDADFLFVIGSNTSEAHPIIAMEMKRAVRNGATLVVADPRSIWMTTLAEKHLKLRPGTDVWLLNAMAHVIVAEGLVDQDFVAVHTDGFEAVREAVASYTPEEAEQVTGVPAEDIRWTARRYATTRRAGIYYTLGITEHSHGTDNVYALANLVLMTGHLGVASAGMNPLRGQNNVQGANDAGATPVFYPGYQRVDDPEARARYEASWGVSLPDNVGLNLNQMMKEVGKSVLGLYVMGEDIVLSEPNVSRLEQGLNKIEFLVLQDIFANETMPLRRRGAPGGELRREGRRLHQLRAARPEGAQGGVAAGRGTRRLGDPVRRRGSVRRRVAALRLALGGLRRDGARRRQVLRHQPSRGSSRRAVSSGRAPLRTIRGRNTSTKEGCCAARACSRRSSTGPRSSWPSVDYPAGPVHWPDPLPLQRRDPDAARRRRGGQAARGLRRDPPERRAQAGDRQTARRSRSAPGAARSSCGR